MTDSIQADGAGWMPTFFFDFIDGPHRTRDEEGHACESAEAARAELMRVLPEVLLGSTPSDVEREVVCSVRDERGSVLFRASVTLKVEEMSGR